MVQLRSVNVSDAGLTLPSAEVLATPMVTSWVGFLFNTTVNVALSRLSLVRRRVVSLGSIPVARVTITPAWSLSRFVTFTVWACKAANAGSALVLGSTMIWYG